MNQNIYKPITDFDTVSNYPLSYSITQPDSSTYVKVDVAVGVNDSSLDPKSYWNVDSSIRYIQDVTMTYQNNPEDYYDFNYDFSKGDTSIVSGLSRKNSGYDLY